MVENFEQLGLTQPLCRALHELGYETPTPIQARAIPPLLAGSDLVGIAQTGTGKTAAFMLPILQALTTRPVARVSKAPRVLIVSPTRELATQIGESGKAYSRYLDVRGAVIFGGVGQRPQVDKLRAGVDVLVATPGRLLDLMNQGHVRLSNVEVCVLDEADRMLDMGFIHDVRKIVAALPKARQMLLFSATMPKAIVELSNKMLNRPVRVAVTPPATTVERIEQRVLFVDKGNKRNLLLSLLSDRAFRRSLVFTRTKHGANRTAQFLQKAGVQAEAIHGNKSQRARESALRSFKKGDIRVLVATDVAARGIDVPDVTHVINFDLPPVPEDYVHRIGRTARAGRDGVAMSFCDENERAYLKAIQRKTTRKLDVVDDHPFTVESKSKPKERAWLQKHDRRATRDSANESALRRKRRKPRGGEYAASKRKNVGNTRGTRTPTSPASF